jgi:hypothetical protein
MFGDFGKLLKLKKEKSGAPRLSIEQQLRQNLGTKSLG